MDITFRRLPTTPAEIDHLTDVAETCEAMAKAAAMRAREIRAYARQHPHLAAMVEPHLHDAEHSMGLWACLAGINFEILRRPSSTTHWTTDSWYAEGPTRHLRVIPPLRPAPAPKTPPRPPQRPWSRSPASNPHPPASTTPTSRSRSGHDAVRDSRRIHRAASLALCWRVGAVPVDLSTSATGVPLATDRPVAGL